MSIVHRPYGQRSHLRGSWHVWTGGAVLTFLALSCKSNLKEDSLASQVGAGELRLISGNNQIAMTGAALPTLLIVRAFDSLGAPAPGINVTWTVNQGTIDEAETISDPTGTVRAQWTLGSEIGEQTASVSSNGLNTVVFTSTAIGLVQILLTPPTVTLAPGGTSQFHAEGILSDRRVVTPAVEYRVTDGKISTDGFFQAPSTPGFVLVIAEAIGVADTSTVNVVAPAATLVSLSLAPSSATVPIGGIQQFSVVGVMSDGSQNIPAVNYNQTGGSITTEGEYRAGTNSGTFRVIATQQGGTIADTAQVIIVSGGGGGGGGTPDILMNASFESGFDGFVNGSGGTPDDVVRSTDRAKDGTVSLKLPWSSGGEIDAQCFYDIGPQTHFWTRYWYYITPALPNGTGFKFVRYQDGGFDVANGMQILNGNWVWVGNSNEAIAYTNTSPILGSWHYVEFEWDRTAKQIRMWQDGTPMQGASADAGLRWSGATLTYTSDIGPRNLDLLRVINARTNTGAVYLDRIAVSTKPIGP